MYYFFKYKFTQGIPAAEQKKNTNYIESWLNFLQDIA